MTAALELWASGRLSGLAILLLRLAIRGYARGWIGRATFHRLVARAAPLQTAISRWQAEKEDTARGTTNRRAAPVRRP